LPQTWQLHPQDASPHQEELQSIVQKARTWMTRTTPCWKARARAESIAEKMDKLEFRAAQEEILSVSSAFNSYLSMREPWKEKDPVKLGRQCISARVG